MDGIKNLMIMMIVQMINDFAGEYWLINILMKTYDKEMIEHGHPTNLKRPMLGQPFYIILCRTSTRYSELTDLSCVAALFLVATATNKQQQKQQQQRPNTTTNKHKTYTYSTIVSHFN